MRRLLVLAIVTAAVLGLLWLNQRASAPPATGDKRGDTVVAVLQPDGPTGTVLGAPTFRWKSPLTNARYRVTVRRGSTVVWEGVVETTEATVPNSIGLEPGAEYTWQVEAINKEGEASMTSPPQTFVIS